jgi:hypothetical protein
MQCNLSRALRVSFLFAELCGAPAFAQEAAPLHPLDGLSTAEYWAAYDVLYPVHVMTRKFLGEMTRKLSVTESQKCAQLRGTCSRRKPSVASANCAQVA